MSLSSRREAHDGEPATVLCTVGLECLDDLHEPAERRLAVFALQLGRVDRDGRDVVAHDGFDGDVGVRAQVHDPRRGREVRPLRIRRRVEGSQVQILSAGQWNCRLEAGRP